MKSPGPYHADVADEWDPVPVPLGSDLTLFHRTRYYAAYRQKSLGIEGYFEPAPKARESLLPTENLTGVLAADPASRSQCFDTG